MTWLVVAFGWCLASSTGAAAVRDFELLSINSAGTASGGGLSRNPVVSSNGQYVAFVSEAANLVANDANGARDVFWRDRVAGVTRLVSRTPAGASGNGESDAPVMSADGRYVAFHSRASNLVTGDTNGRYDVFVWDSQNDSVTLVSRTVAGGSGAGNSFSPRMSASGRVIAFASDAPNLAGTDTNGTLDAFARDLDAGVTHLVSATPGGAAGNGSCAVPVISANGRFVAFASLANNLAGNDTNGVDDIFVRDLQTQTTVLASVNPADTASGSRFSFEPNLSADGRYVAFASQATNLVATPDTNGVADVFVRDLQLGQTKLVSVNGSGTAAGGNAGVATLRAESVSPVLSADGTKVLFISFAQDLVANDGNAAPDVFLRDHVNNTTTLISTNRFGTGTGNGISGAGLHAMSADGRYVAFFSEASNLGAADTNNRTDVFLRDLQTGGTKILSRVRDGGFAANGHSFQPVLSADGSTVLFATEADNLDDRDANGVGDVFAAATTLPAPSFAVADVGVAVTVFSGVVVGTNFTATVTVTNRSANFVTGLVLSNSGPSFLEFLSATASQGTIGTDLWFVGDLAANASASATITLVATNAGTGAVAAAVLRLDQTDLINGNDTASSPVTASFTGTDLVLTGTGPTTTYYGSNFLVSLVVSNRGPATATAVVVTNADPGDVVFAGVTTSQGTVDMDGTWTVGSLAVGATATFTATLTPEGSGFLLFRAGVSSALTDTHPPNDTVNLGVTLPNLPPNLRFASNTLTLPEDLPSLSFPAFLQVHPTESNQLITNLSVSVDNPSLFTTAPALNTNGLLTLTLAPNVNGTSVVSVLATDNGGTLGGGVPTGSNAFTIVVTPVNDPPLFGFATNHVQALEDAGPQTLPGFITSLTTGPGDESAQSVTNYFVTTTSNALFAVAPAVALNGTLTFTPAANAHGSVTVTVIAQDDGGTANGGVDRATNTFGLTITAVNDPPSVAFTTNHVVVAQDSGAQLFAGFATPGFGPADEAGQAVLSYTVSPNSAALFAVLPAISLGGDLTFTPASGASGSTPVTVVVRDSGGTANGGVDLGTNTFTLTISAPTATNFTWLGGTGDWHDPAQWTPAGVPGALDTATIGTGTVQLTNAVTVAGLALSVTITGAGDLTVASNFTWTSGSLVGPGMLTIPAGGAAALSSGNTKSLLRRLDNAGTVTWTGGTVHGNGNPTFNNLAGGVFDIQADATFFSTTDSSVRTFNNAGTLRKSAGATSTTWEGVMNNTGTVEVQVGTLVFNGSGLSSGVFTNAVAGTLAWGGGTHELTNGVVFAGAGTNRINGGTLLVGAGATVAGSGTFALSSGTFGGAGNFTVPAGSLFTWTAGTIATGGVLTVAAGGAATISTGFTKTLRRQVDNAGTWTWLSGSVQGNDAPTFNNLAGGVFDIQADATFFSTTDSSVRSFNNAGTLRKSVGTGTTDWQGLLNNSGTVAVLVGTLDSGGGGLSSGTFTNAAGALLLWGGGTHELTNGTTFTGPGTNRISNGAVNVSAGATVSHTGTFELTGGALGGAGNFTVSAGSQFNWTGGTMQTGGVFTVAAGGAMAWSGSGTKTLRRQLDNAGTVTWSGGVILGNNHPTLNNQAGGVFDIRVDSTFFSTTDSSVRTFNNAGTLRKTAGAGSTTWEGVMNNTGTVEVQVGTLVFNGSGLSSGAFTNVAGTVLGWTSGIHELTNGVTLTGAGTWALAGATLEVKAGTTVSPAGTFALSSGILGGAGNFTVPSGSTFAWTAGTMQTGGVFTVAAGAALTASTTSTKSLRRQVDNAGTITWTGGTFLAGEDPTLNNLAAGVFDIQTDSTFFSSVDGSVRTFNNSGTLRKTAGAGTTTWEGVLNNAGTVEVRVGTLNPTGAGLSSGIFTNAAGTVLVWSSGAHELTNGVTLTGPGTRRIASGFLLISPGATVNPEGTFELVGGTLGGAGNFTVPAGSQFNWTSGTMATGGVFTVATGGALTMGTTATKVLRRQLDNAGTVTWTSGTVQGNSNPTINNQAGGVFEIQADGTFFSTTDSSVRVFNNLGTLRKTAGAGTTTWEGVFNSLGAVEMTAGTLVFNGSGLSTGSFVNAAGTVLAWTSGTHEVTNGVTFTGPGTRRIAGGTLSVSAASGISPEGTFELVNGTLGGAGNFTVPAGSQFNWTAGTIQTGGVFTVAAGGALTLSTTATKVLRRQLDNAGTVTWTSGTVQGNSNPTFNNLAGGRFEFQADSVFFSTTDSSVRTFNNLGTLRKTAGAGTTTWEGVLNNEGAVTVQTGTLSLTGSGRSSGAFSGAAGTVLAWTSGTHELTNGVTFTGPGTRRITGGTVELTAGTTVSPEGVFEQAGGILGGPGSFTLPAGSQYEWTSGTIQTGGVFTVAAGGALTLGTTATKVLRRQLDNAGTVTWTGGTVQGNSNPTFNNLAGGLFDSQAINTFFATSDSSVPVFNNAGTVRKSAGGGTTTWAGTLNNHGTLDVQTGTLSLTGGGLSSGVFAGTAGALLEWTAGTHTVTNGAAFTGPGTRRIASGATLVVAAGAAVSPAGVFELTSGTLGGAGNFTVPAGGQFNWTAGTIHTGGVFTVAAGGSVTASSTSTKTLRRQLDNHGTFTWTGGQVLGEQQPDLQQPERGGAGRAGGQYVLQHGGLKHAGVQQQRNGAEVGGDGDDDVVRHDEPERRAGAAEGDVLVRGDAELRGREFVDDVSGRVDGGDAVRAVGGGEHDVRGDAERGADKRLRAGGEQQLPHRERGDGERGVRDYDGARAGQRAGAGDELLRR